MNIARQTKSRSTAIGLEASSPKERYLSYIYTGAVIG